MNYKNYKIDGSPEQDICINKCYKVKADIANCFPSIYTHAITWALAGKEKAKAKKNQNTSNDWYHNLDSSITWLNYGETHGLLIGPHSSNLVSEIILVSIDNKLAKYKYIRHIDDYTCYVSSIDEANQFLLDLSQSLREFNLTLNHKKTEIIKLPTPFEEDWIRKLKLFKMETYKKQIKYTGVVPFFDMALELMKENKYNGSILNYAIKILLKKKMTKNAQTYFINIIHHLVLIYPYLIPLLEKIFDEGLIQSKQMSIISTNIFKLGIEKNIYEAMIYALYFALKYNFKIKCKTIAKTNQIQNKEDCILMLLSYLYDKKYNKDLKFYIDTAKSYIIKTTLKTEEINIIDDEFWLFAYEVLRIESPKNLDKCIDWKQLKNKKITFLNRENLAIKGIKGV